ncbi:hypothetical protein AB0O50_18410 [Streptomyces cyaneofuscatus]|uniref:hypothetical protein n=1 Tax=Streptomyces cyaneofuscatus TaxID=66883 RepID=UPI00342521C1
MYEQVQSVPSVAQKFLLPEDREEDSVDPGKVLFHEVAMIPVLLAEMYSVRVGSVDDVDLEILEQLYRELEVYLVADDLRMDVYIPILGADVSGEGDFDYFSIVRLGGEQREILSRVGNVHPRDVRKLCQATHALLIKDAPALAGGCGSSFEVVPYFSTFDLVDQFFDAAALESPSLVGCAQMIFSPNGWFGNVDVAMGANSPYLYRDYATRLDNLTPHSGELDYSAFTRIRGNFGGLSEGHASLRVAARRLRIARERDSDEDRIVDLCIGLESILGGGSGAGEIVHKISMRAAAILSQSGWGRSVDIFQVMKDVYSYRSRVVHGIPGPHKKELLHIDGMPIHASRYALASLGQVLRVALAVEGFQPDKVDAMFIYPALDMAADRLSDQ